MALFLALSMVLMVGDSYKNYSHSVRTVLRAAVSPLQYLVDAPFSLYDWLASSVVTRKALLDENTKLRYDAVVLRAQLQKFISLKKENADLRDLLSTSVAQAGRVLVAQLLAVDTSAYRELMVLNKGSMDDVYQGQAVLDAVGVMGQIIEVGPNTSTVLLINDVKSAVPVKNGRTGERGIVVGNMGSDRLVMVNLPKTARVKVGDTMVSSGLARRFPEGYPVGIVSKVKIESGQAFLSVSLEPAAKLNRSRLMLLVWPNQKELAINAQLKTRPNA